MQLQKAQAQCASEHDAVVALGGLHIIGTERHEARRIDNQLRGRAGRQETRAPRVFICRWKMTSYAFSAQTVSPASWPNWAWKKASLLSTP